MHSPFNPCFTLLLLYISQKKNPAQKWFSNIWHYEVHCPCKIKVHCPVVIQWFNFWFSFTSALPLSLKLQRKQWLSFSNYCIVLCQLWLYCTLWLFQLWLYCTLWASLVAQMVKNPPAMRETWVQFLSWEDSLEKEIATNSNILAWRIPWTEEPGGLQFMGSQRVRRYWITKYNTLSVEMGQRRECCCHSCKWEGFHL